MRRLGVYNALIEGDTFPAIQWGLGKISYPWRLADWVEEVQSISAQLNCKFIHIFREANEATDALAVEGSSL